jgi:hypothetical protein
MRTAVGLVVFGSLLASFGNAADEGAHPGSPPAVFTNLEDVRWEKFSSDQPDSDLARIAFLRVDPDTHATQLLIKLPPDY